MAAAITAALNGLKVLVIEKTPVVGGSTAVSGGMVWAPGNSAMAAAGAPDVAGAALAYLRAEVGNRLREDMARAYIETAPRMFDFFRLRTEVQLVPRMYAPDYHPDQPGASNGGRALDPVVFDGRMLGPWFAKLRPPLPQMTIFGGMMVGKADIDHLLAMWRKWPSFRHAMAIMGRYIADRLRYPRGTRLLAGNALAGRLLKTAIDAGVTIETESTIDELIVMDGAVIGAAIRVGGRAQRIAARRGVVLATGGSAANVAARKDAALYPDDHLSMVPEGNVGDGIAVARSVGATIETGNASNLFLSPVSVSQEHNGTRVQFPHLILDRQKPGLIAVDGSGRRFTNEAQSYHDFAEAMQERNRSVSAIPTYLVCDHAFLRKYGLGLVRPAPFPHRRHIRNGYLIKARTLAALAAKLGIPADALIEEVEAMNQAAETGIDGAFGKGSTEYNRYLGDPRHGPNPCLGPIRAAPFYAVRVFPGDIGSTRGLRTDPQARVLASGGAPIAGLYACGNDMNSIMGGAYPAGGITLGPALTFGYIAGLHMAGVARDLAKERPVAAAS